MSTKDGSTSADRTAELFEELCASAERLNAVSDEFSKTIAPIDAALKRLNLGVAAWHAYFKAGPDHDGEYWERRIGYARVGGKWGLALATESGNMHYEDVQEWLFNDAPRPMRAEAIDHIPTLLEEMIKRADETATELRKKSGTARELAASISGVVPSHKARR